MARRRRLTANAEARDELLAATLWYDAQRDGLGLQLLGAVRECLERIVAGTGAGSIVPGTPAALQTRRAPVHRFPYAIIYIDMVNEVRVLAFAHGHRRPPKARVLATPPVGSGQLPHSRVTMH